MKMNPIELYELMWKVKMFLEYHIDLYELMWKAKIVLEYQNR